jgi:hypothetical protein
VASTSASPGGSSPASPRDLLRPPAHRGPLIAAGAVLVTVGVALEEIRLDEKLPLGVHLVILALAAGVIYALGVQPRAEGRPYAFQSVLLVCGLLLLAAALLTLADVLGADFNEFPAGALVWTSLLLAGAAAWPAAERNSSICALVAAAAVGLAVLSFVNWAFGANSATTYRWLLALLVLAYALAALLLRGSAPRHSEQMANAAGLAVLTLALTGVLPALLGAIPLFGSGPVAVLPNGWELVVFAAGCGLVAYGAVDRAPGPAYLGVANLLAFVVSAGTTDEVTLLYWPLLILLLGLGAMITGLRPRSPLPPEPSAYRSGSLPLASRADEDEPVLRVRDDSPPR